MAAQAKPEISKSQIIRDFVTKNPTLSISEVATMLAERGTKVSKNLVYVVKGKMKAMKHKEKKEKAAAVASTASSNGAAKNKTKSSAVRAILKGDRKMKAKDVVAALAEKGIEVAEGLVYFVKGQMKGKRGQKKKAQKEAAQVVATATVAPVSSNGDAVKTIMMVKGWAAEVGGMKKLKALVEALSE